MRVVYLAHPIRNSSLWSLKANIRAAEKIALAIWMMGAVCICPGKNTEDFDGAAPDETWLKGDLEILARCDGLVAAPGHAQSRGATGEIEEAIRLGIPVFYWPVETARLKSWIKITTNARVYPARVYPGGMVCWK